jgi:hypothetical protein
MTAIRDLLIIFRRMTISATSWSSSAWDDRYFATA